MDPLQEMMVELFCWFNQLFTKEESRRFAVNIFHHCSHFFELRYLKDSALVREFNTLSHDDSSGIYQQSHMLGVGNRLYYRLEKMNREELEAEMSMTREEFLAKLARQKEMTPEEFIEKHEHDHLQITPEVLAEIVLYLIYYTVINSPNFRDTLNTRYPTLVRMYDRQMIYGIERLEEAYYEETTGDLLVTFFMDCFNEEIPTTEHRNYQTQSTVQ